MNKTRFLSLISIPLLTLISCARGGGFVEINAKRLSTKPIEEEKSFKSGGAKITYFNVSRDEDNNFIMSPSYSYIIVDKSPDALMRFSDNYETIKVTGYRDGIETTFTPSETYIIGNTHTYFVTGYSDIKIEYRSLNTAPINIGTIVFWC